MALNPVTNPPAATMSPDMVSAHPATRLPADTNSRNRGQLLQEALGGNHAVRPGAYVRSLVTSQDGGASTHSPCSMIPLCLTLAHHSQEAMLDYRVLLEKEREAAKEADTDRECARELVSEQRLTDMLREREKERDTERKSNADMMLELTRRLGELEQQSTTRAQHKEESRAALSSEASRLVKMESILEKVLCLNATVPMQSHQPSAVVRIPQVAYFLSRRRMMSVM